MSELTQEERERRWDERRKADLLALKALHQAHKAAWWALEKDLASVPLYAAERDADVAYHKALLPMAEYLIEDALALLASQEENQGFRERVAFLENALKDATDSMTIKVADSRDKYMGMRTSQIGQEVILGGAYDNGELVVVADNAPELAAYLRGRTKDVGERA